MISSSKCLIAAAAIFGGLTVAAAAADLQRPMPAPAPAPYPESIVSYGFKWTGAYVGANVGSRWVDTNVSSLGSSFGLNSNSAVGGLQAGYLWQMGALVLGAEADFDWGANEKSGVSGIGTVTTSLDWQSTLRARAGYAFDQFLIYGTGGVAFAGVEAKGNGSAVTATQSDTRTGWTVGGGLEYAFSNNISLRGEYLYSDFGSMDVTYPATGLANNKQDITSSLGRLGVNFKF